MARKGRSRTKDKKLSFEALQDIFPFYLASERERERESERVARFYDNFAKRSSKYDGTSPRYAEGLPHYRSLPNRYVGEHKLRQYEAITPPVVLFWCQHEPINTVLGQNKPNRMAPRKRHNKSDSPAR